MKAILEFELPIDAQEYQDAVKGSDWRWAMEEIVGFLRRETKHANHTADEYAMLDKVRERISEILEDRSLDLYG